MSYRVELVLKFPIKLCKNIWVLFFRQFLKIFPLKKKCKNLSKIIFVFESEKL